MIVVDDETFWKNDDKKKQRLMMRDWIFNGAVETLHARCLAGG
jgi:hypothetical protein